MDNGECDLQILRDALSEQMVRNHGELLGGTALVRALGYNSSAALRQARRRDHVAVTLFTLPNRRGVYALTREIADWLAISRHRTATQRP